MSIAADTNSLFCGPDWVTRHLITGGSLVNLEVEGFALKPVGIDFVSLVDPEPRSPMGDWLAALEAEAAAHKIGML